jgi:RecB family exonuclease
MDHLPTDPTEYTAFRLQEERRLAYTAMTRARRRVVWTATAVGSEAGRGVPSRFLPLVAGVSSLAQIPINQPEQTDPVSPREAEAQLRRRAADPTVAEPTRLAAVAALAQGERWGMRPAQHHHGVVERGSERGLNGAQLRLSPSQADGYAKCPRRYAIERKLSQAGDSIYATFGSLVHDVLDHVETDAMNRGQRHSDYPSAVRKLDELMDPTDFGGEPFAEAWRRRAQDGLARLYSMWPAGARPIAIERDVAFELGDVTWRGRIDRLERDDAGIRVVDYKTSRTAVSQTEAAESLQLGFYALAVAADPALIQHGEPTAAEFWYPLATSKKKLTIRSLDMSLLPNIGQRLIDLGRDIAAERWDPAPGEWCERCPFASSCPARPDGGDQFA